MIVRAETPADISAIRSVTQIAFADAEHSSQTEGAILDALRRAGALILSLVAEQDGRIVGHVGFSPVTIDGADAGWVGLGPVSVLPGHRRAGVGAMLIEEGLARMRRSGAAGCVVLGDPRYYSRFGFTGDHALRYGDVPPEYLQSLVLSGAAAEGEVEYHEGFAAR